MENFYKEAGLEDFHDQRRQLASQRPAKHDNAFDLHVFMAMMNSILQQNAEMLRMLQQSHQPSLNGSQVQLPYYARFPRSLFPFSMVRLSRKAK